MLCLSDSFLQKTTRQSGGSCSFTCYSQLVLKYSKYCLFISAKKAKEILWATSVARQDAGTAFHPIVDFTFFWWVTLKGYYRNWTHCVSHIHTWTVSIHCPSIDSVEVLLSRVVTCLILCTEQSFLSKETSDWTECPAWRKKDTWGTTIENLCWAHSKNKINANQ